MPDEDEVQQKPEPKISNTEALLIGLGIVVLDLIDIIPLAGDITDGPALLVNYYLYSKGVNGLWFVIAEVLDLIPGPQELPTRTVAWCILLWLDRHPSAATALAEQAGEMAEGKAGAKAEAGALEKGAEGATKAGEEASKTAATIEGEAGMATREGATVEAGATAAPGAGEVAGGEGGGAASETGASRGGEGGEGAEEGGRTPEELEKERKLKEIFEQGAQKPPEEEAEEELFNPEETQFHEAGAPGTKQEQEEGEDEEEDLPMAA